MTNQQAVLFLSWFDGIWSIQFFVNVWQVRNPMSRLWISFLLCVCFCLSDVIHHNYSDIESSIILVNTEVTIFSAFFLFFFRSIFHSSGVAVCDDSLPLSSSFGISALCLPLPPLHWLTTMLRYVFIIFLSTFSSPRSSTHFFFLFVFIYLTTLYTYIYILNICFNTFHWTYEIFL